MIPAVVTRRAQLRPVSRPATRRQFSVSQRVQTQGDQPPEKQHFNPINYL